MSKKTSDDDPILICILLGLCAAVGGPEQREAAIKMVHQERPKFTPAQCRAAADRLLARYDNFRGVAAAIDDHDAAA